MSVKPSVYEPLAGVSRLPQNHLDRLIAMAEQLKTGGELQPGPVDPKKLVMDKFRQGLTGGR